jgi:hypothetical protein
MIGLFWTRTGASDGFKFMQRFSDFIFAIFSSAWPLLNKQYICKSFYATIFWLVFARIKNFNSSIR